MRLLSRIGKFERFGCNFVVTGMDEMLRKIARLGCGVFFGAVLAMDPLFAVSEGGGLSPVRVGEAIVVPTRGLNINGENPAGQMFIDGFDLFAGVYSGSGAASPTLLSGLGYGEESSWGIGAGSQTADSKDGASTFLLAGGYYLSEWDLGVGLNTVLVRQGPNSALGASLGLIYNPEGDLRVGLVLNDVFYSYYLLGLGIAYDFNEYILASLEGNYYRGLETVHLVPSVRVSLPPYVFTSFGYRYVKDRNEEWVGGVGLEFFERSLNVQFLTGFFGGFVLGRIASWTIVLDWQLGGAG